MNTTDFVVIAAITLLLGWEVWTLFNGVPNDTISESVWRIAQRYSLVPFLAGLLCGHWFWPRGGK